MRRALPRLVLRWRVTALVRRRDPQLAALGVTQIEGDLDRPATLARLAGIERRLQHRVAAVGGEAVPAGLEGDAEWSGRGHAIIVRCEDC